MSFQAGDTRECAKCGKVKPLEEFPVAQRTGGMTYYRRVCKVCRASYERQWRTDNKYSLSEKKQRYYLKHRDETLKRVKNWQIKKRDYKLAYQRAWYLANATKLRERQRCYYSENPGIARAYREKNKAKLSQRMKDWRSRNREKILVYNTGWKAVNRERLQQYAVAYRKRKPEIKRLSEARRRALKKGTGGTVSAPDILELFSKQMGKCVYCATSLKGSYQLDHIVPLARGGTHTIANIQLLCSSCNRRKHAKTHDEYMEYLTRTAGESDFLMRGATKTHLKRGVGQSKLTAVSGPGRCAS